MNYCPTCKRYDFHAGSCADQNALLDYPYGKHPIPYPAMIINGMEVRVHHGITLKPKWYDFPRRLGWRAKKRQTIFRDGCCIIDKINNVIYCTPAFADQLRIEIPEDDFNLRNPF